QTAHHELEVLLGTGDRENVLSGVIGRAVRDDVARPAENRQVGSLDRNAGRVGDSHANQDRLRLRGSDAPHTRTKGNQNDGRQQQGSDGTHRSPLGYINVYEPSRRSPTRSPTHPYLARDRWRE